MPKRFSDNFFKQTYLSEEQDARKQVIGDLENAGQYVEEHLANNALFGYKPQELIAHIVAIKKLALATILEEVATAEPNADMTSVYRQAPLYARKILVGTTGHKIIPTGPEKDILKLCPFIYTEFGAKAASAYITYMLKQLASYCYIRPGTSWCTFIPQFEKLIKQQLKSIFNSDKKAEDFITATFKKDDCKDFLEFFTKQVSVFNTMQPDKTNFTHQNQLLAYCNQDEAAIAQKIFHFYPAPAVVPELMQAYAKKLCNMLQDKTIPPIKIAAWAHNEFVRIHPFLDGNGRVAQLIANGILMAFDYPPIIFYTNLDEKINYLINVQADVGEQNLNIQKFLEASLTKKFCAAVYQGRIAEINEFFAKVDFNINSVLQDGATSLHYACKRGDPVIVKLLIDHGANPLIKTKKNNLPETFIPDSLPEAQKAEIIDVMKHSMLS